MRLERTHAMHSAVHTRMYACSRISGRKLRLNNTKAQTRGACTEEGLRALGATHVALWNFHTRESMGSLVSPTHALA